MKNKASKKEKKILPQLAMSHISDGIEGPIFINRPNFYKRLKRFLKTELELQRLVLEWELNGHSQIVNIMKVIKPVLNPIMDDVDQERDWEYWDRKIYEEIALLPKQVNNINSVTSAKKKKSSTLEQKSKNKF